MNIRRKKESTDYRLHYNALDFMMITLMTDNALSSSDFKKTLRP
ncbi:MAG: hypothetical protein ACE5EH_12900 [Gammaproteobacteria bacterium]